MTTVKITMIGTGYVGLVSGACFAELGHQVVCVDIDPAKIKSLSCGEIPIYEPGLEELVKRNVDASRLSFTTDLSKVAGSSDAIFICVGTPPHPEDGSADLKFVQAAAHQIGALLDGYTVIVNKSTVPVGTGEKVEQWIAEGGQGEHHGGRDYDVVSNPEFLREGAAIEDFLKPDRVVVGTESAKAHVVMDAIYKPLQESGHPVLFTKRETAELIKYAANGFLATKIAFINEMADLCETLGADISEVAKGIGMDTRIGDKFLNAGPGYGGSCFPKDTMALAKTAQDAQRPSRIVEAVIEANDVRKKSMASKIETALGQPLKGKTVAILGLTFKAGTDDMRESPSLTIVPELLSRGAHVKAYDPEGMEEAKKELADVTYCSSKEEALDGADVCSILTEWPEFATLDWQDVKSRMSSAIIVDLRNLYDPSEVREKGVVYSSIGR